MERKDYNEILIKYYTENHSFIEKAIFTVTAGAITFLLGYSDKINKEFTLFYSVCVLFFVITLFTQLGSAYVSREGCDLGLDETNDKIAEEKFNLSRMLNNIFLYMFCISVFSTSIMIILNSNVNPQNNMHNYFIEHTISTDDYNYYERRVLMNKKEYNNGLNPPKSITTSMQDGFNPPKTPRPKPTPSKPKK